MSMFTSYAEKFESMRKHHEHVKRVEAAFKKWWAEDHELHDSLATGEYEEIRQLVYDAFEAGVWMAEYIKSEVDQKCR